MGTKLNMEDFYDDTDEQAPESTMPESVADFISGLDIDRTFRITLKRTKGVNKGVLRTFSPDEKDEAEFENIGRIYGPGTYQYLINWYSPQAKKKLGRSFTITLAGDHYQEEHEAYLADQARKKALSSPAPANNENIGEVVNSQVNNVLAMAQGLAAAFKPEPAPIQASADQSLPAILAMMQAQQERSSQMLAALISGGAAIATAFINRPKPMEVKAENEPMKNFQSLVEMAKSMIDLKQLSAPPEKETVAEKMIGTITENLPTVLSLVSMRAEERAKSLPYKMVKNSSELKAVENDPELQGQVVSGLAKQIGVIKTRSIVEALGWTHLLPEIDAYIEAKQAPSSDQ